MPPVELKLKKYEKFLIHQWSPRKSSMSRLKPGTSPAFCFVVKESLPTWQALSSSGSLNRSSPNLLGWWG